MIGRVGPISARKAYPGDSAMRMLHGLAFAFVAFALSVSDAQQTGTYVPGRGLSPIALLRIKSVHNELKATPEQARKLDDLSHAMVKTYREGGIQTRGLTPEEIRAKALELGRAREEALRKDLTDILKPEQVRRFEQIAVQQLGIFAFQFDHRVREALKLTEPQKAGLQAIDQEMKEALNAATLAYSKDRQGGAAGLLAVRTQILVKYLALLTDEQKVTWNDLNGEPFVIVVE